jgi:hypothetical protein
VNAIPLNEIVFRPELASVLQKLRVKEGTRSAREVEDLLTEAQAVARPKALYRVAYVDQEAEDSVRIGGQTFKSRVLRVNLEPVHRVFPFVATCGTELDEWSSSIDGMLEGYWADAIKEMALRSAMHALGEHLQQRFRPGRMSRMNPGSLQDWPLREQRKLFALLGDPEDAIGVRLTESLIMVPLKSVSGIWFPTEVDFASCQLCPREGCPGRRAPYDQTLLDTKYRSVAG